MSSLTLHKNLNKSHENFTLSAYRRKKNKSTGLFHILFYEMTYILCVFFVEKIYKLQTKLSTSCAKWFDLLWKISFCTSPYYFHSQTNSILVFKYYIINKYNFYWEKFLFIMRKKFSFLFLRFSCLKLLVNLIKVVMSFVKIKLLLKRSNL